MLFDEKHVSLLSNNNEVAFFSYYKVKIVQANNDE